MAITQKRMDQLIVQAKRKHFEHMERMRVAFLGNRAEPEDEFELEPEELVPFEEENATNTAIAADVSAIGPGGV